MEVEDAMLGEIVAALDLGPAAGRVLWSESGNLPSCFPVTALAASAVGAAALALSDLLAVDGPRPTVTVDRRLASLWFGFSVRPQGWSLPGGGDAVAGDYRAGDGWIKLHTNAPSHKAAALAVLGCGPTRDAVERAVRDWSADALEEAVVGGGGCAAMLRERGGWCAHPQGRAVAAEPLALRDPVPDGTATDWRPAAGRPLAGLRVLDLTRVLAGPVATRFLAGYGADVLRIDAPGWDEPGVAPEVMPGKRGARLDLRDADGRRAFERLLSEADVLVHGYRSDALDRLGFGAERRQAVRPGLIDVSLDAYGHGGPWSRRRGFDSLVQFSSGIAAIGREWRGGDAPMSLPVQALDQATGYLMAAAVLRGVTARLRCEPASSYRLSLARTAEMLFRHGSAAPGGDLGPETDDDLAPGVELTSWGPARPLRPPVEVATAAMWFGIPAVDLGSSRPEWRS